MTARLDLDGVSVRFRDRLALADVSAHWSTGELVAVVGPNGAGKTSLVRAILGLVPATGRILIDGQEARTLDTATRARRLGYLPQLHEATWSLPVRDIVGLGRFPHGARDPSRLGPADRAAVERAMTAVGVRDFADRPVTQLSGGERARVALARVLATETPIILADEATAALDPRYRIEIMELLRALARDGRLVVAVTHDLVLAARLADQVLVLDGGRAVTAGPPEAALGPSVLSGIFQVGSVPVSDGAATVHVPWTVASARPTLVQNEGSGR